MAYLNAIGGGSIGGGKWTVREYINKATDVAGMKIFRNGYMRVVCIVNVLISTIEATTLDAEDIPAHTFRIASVSYDSGGKNPLLGVVAYDDTTLTHFAAWATNRNNSYLIGYCNGVYIAKGGLTT